LIQLDAAGLIVSANERFLRLVDHDHADVVGRKRWTDLLTAGSRLLFEAQLVPVLTLDGAIDEIMVDLAGSGGRRVPALMSAESIFDRDRRLVGCRIALMAVPDRREYENRLREARELAEVASAQSAHARARLELLAAANTALASSVDVGVAFTRLARMLVRDVADWCVIYAADPTGDSPSAESPLWAAAHVEPGQQPALDRLAELMPVHSTSTSALRRVLEENKPILFESVTAEYQASGTDSPELLDLYTELGLASAMVVPSFARGHRVAALVLARGPGRPPFTTDDLADLTDLGARTGIAIDNLRRAAREHSNSVALQQALLTPPPTIEPFEIVTRYLPATDGAEIGGDWYDAFAQPGGGVAIVIGDVIGHDIQAAAQMGQLRGIIRTIANTIGGTPGDTLTRTDDAAPALNVQTLATAIIAQIEREPSDDTGGRIALWSNAGHPPPILISADGDVRILQARSDPLLGVHLGVERHDHAVDLHPGDTLLLYTDGLIERADQDINTGLAGLTAAVAGGQGTTLDELADAILLGHDGRQDDIAILLVRIRPSSAMS
jgi:hypothetical protein